eukprot:COSAG01_NODE_467_length_16597_cov_10.933446_4_plen_62_part_00
MASSSSVSSGLRLRVTTPSPSHPSCGAAHIQECLACLVNYSRLQPARPTIEVGKLSCGIRG